MELDRTAMDRRSPTRGAFARTVARVHRRSPSARWVSRSASTPECSASSTRCCCIRCRTRTSIDSCTSPRSAPGSDMPEEFGVAAEFFLQYKEQSKLLQDVATYNSFTSTMRAGDRVERIRMSFPTNSLFSTLGAKPILGRLPRPRTRVTRAVISSAMWTVVVQRRFGRHWPRLLRSPATTARWSASWGRNSSFRLTAPCSGFPARSALKESCPAASACARLRARDAGHDTRGRRATSSPRSVEGAAASDSAERRTTPRSIAQHRAVVRTLDEQMLGFVARPLWVLLGAVGIVLLIACANVANLFLVRAEGTTARSRRSARDRRGARTAGSVADGRGDGRRGARRRRSPSILAALTLPAFLRAAPPEIPRLADVHINVTTCCSRSARRWSSALACGLVPAIRASSPDLDSTARRKPRLDATAQLGARRTGRRTDGAGARSAHRFRACSCEASGRSRHVDPGYDTTNIFTFQIAPEGPNLRDGPAFAQFELNFMDRLRALPGVEIGWARRQHSARRGDVRRRGSAPRRWASNPDAGTLLNYTFAAGDYYKAMGIKVLRGRPFETSDHTSTLGNVVISRTAANLLWPGKDPIGRRMQMDGLTTWETVVGVVDDVMQYDFRDTPQALVYFPLVGLPTQESLDGASPAYVVKTRRAETIAPEIRALVHTVAPTAPMYRVYTMAGLAKELDGTTLVHDADARHRVGARADSGRGWSLRRAVVRRRATNARDRRAHGAWRARRARSGGWSWRRAREWWRSASSSVSPSRCCPRGRSTVCSSA